MNTNLKISIIACTMSLQLFSLEVPTAILDGRSHHKIAIDILPDGQVVCLTDDNPGVVVRDFGNREIASYPHQAWVTAIAKSSTASQFATGCSDGTIQVWDTKTRDRAFVLNAGEQVTQITWDSSGNQLVTFDYSDRAKLWDLRNQRLLRAFQGNGGVSSSAITPDARQVIVGYLGAYHVDTPVWIYSSENSQQPIKEFALPDAADVFEIKVNPSGQWLAVGDSGNDIFLFNTSDNKKKTKKLPHRFKSQSVQETLLAFDGDSRGSEYLAATGFPNGEIGIWRLKGQSLARVIKTPSRGAAIAWCLSGKYMATAHDDSKNRIWAVT